MIKITVYLDETDLALLKAAATIHNCSVSEIVRRAIRQTCSPNDPEIKRALKKIKKTKTSFGTVALSRLRATRAGEKTKRARLRST